MIIRVEELCRQIVGAWPRYRLLLLIFNLWVRVVEVDRHYLFRDRRPEGTSDLTSHSLGQIEAKHRIISCRSWFKRCMLQLFCIVSSFNTRLENVHTSGYVSSWPLWVISSNRRVGLFEVYIYSNWLDEVQRIVFIERQSKASLWIELWSFRVFLD